MNDPLADHEVPVGLPVGPGPAQAPSPPGPRSSRVLEALVAACIVVSLAGVTMPLVSQQVAEGRRDQAILDMQQIVNGLRAYSQDTLTLPTGDRGRTNVTWLYGPGILPGDNPFEDKGDSRPLEDVLQSDAMGGPDWRGPYMDELPVDPWGNAYLVNVDGLIDRREQAMVLSAGPDGVCDTTPFDHEARGDDLLLPVN